MENPCSQHADIVKDLKKITSAIDQLKSITVRNGSQKTMPLPDLLGELWECSVILRDFNKFHCLCKKYHIYKLVFSFIVIFILTLLGISIKDIFLKLFT
ncbi:MAG: hypothetical protein NTV87_16565 [Ignavibacteriae bacterium]|nr:hypothetical protein [Ignavibacteriota bacterium]